MLANEQGGSAFQMHLDQTTWSLTFPGSQKDFNARMEILEIKQLERAYNKRMWNNNLPVY